MNLFILYSRSIHIPFILHQQSLSLAGDIRLNSNSPVSRLPCCPSDAGGDVVNMIWVYSNHQKMEKENPTERVINYYVRPFLGLLKTEYWLTKLGNLRICSWFQMSRGVTRNIGTGQTRIAKSGKSDERAGKLWPFMDIRTFVVCKMWFVLSAALTKC